MLLCGYEMLIARDALDPDAPHLHPRRTKRPSPSPLAEGEDVDAMLKHLRSAFLAIHYAHPHTVEPMVRSWAEVFARARLHRREVAMIRGLAQQIEWAARQLPEEYRRDVDESEPPA